MSLWIDTEQIGKDNSTESPPTDSNSTTCILWINASYLSSSTLLYFLCASSFLIFLHSWTVHRKKALPGCHWHHPGMTVPLDFLRSENHRAALAIAFGATTSLCLSLFFHRSHTIKNVWLSFLYRVGAVFIAGLLYYPMFLGLHYGHRLLPVLVSFLYTACLFGMKLYGLIDCLEDAGKGKEIGSVLAIPEFFCLIFLIIYSEVQLVRICIWKYKNRSLSAAVPCSALEDTWEAKYVTQLLKRRSDVSSDCDSFGWTSVWKRTVRKVYDREDAFRYSIRILAPLVVSIIAVYQLAVVLMYALIIAGEAFQSVADSGSVWSNVTRRDIAHSLKPVAQVLEGGGVISATIGGTFSLFYLLFIAASYKKSMKELYYGAHSLQRTTAGLQTMGGVRRLLCFMRFMGYQTAYILTGFAVVWLITLLLCLFIGFCMIVAKDFGRAFFSTLYNVLEPLLVVMLLYVANRLLAYFTFLDKREKGLVFKNRRFFNNFNYFNFFFNMMLGIASAFLRVGFSVIFGSLMLPRLDRPLLMEGFTRWDFGYQTFLGFLAVELEVTHPCLVVFSKLLVRSIAKKDYMMVLPVTRHVYSDDRNPYSRLHSVASGSSIEEDIQRHHLARNRWSVAVTLLNNPSLVKLRKHACCQFRYNAAEVSAISSA